MTYYTDPACPWSWAAEPALRRLQAEFGDGLTITYVMGGLAREFARPVETMRHVLDATAASGMPVDPRLWLDHPPKSSYPACQGVKAAAEQGLDGPYLRVVREGMMVERRALDTADALVDAARRVPGMNVERFAIDLRSHAIVEAFGYDLEATRTVPDDARAAGKVADAHGSGERMAFPSAIFTGADGAGHGVYGAASYDDLRAAAVAAGAEPAAGGAEPPSVDEALRRFGRMATREVEEVCRLPEPRAQAELWRLAADWRVRPVRVVTGWLWELA